MRAREKQELLSQGLGSRRLASFFSAVLPLSFAQRDRPIRIRTAGAFDAVGAGAQVDHEGAAATLAATEQVQHFVEGSVTVPLRQEFQRVNAGIGTDATQFDPTVRPIQKALAGTERRRVHPVRVGEQKANYKKADNNGLLVYQSSGILLSVIHRRASS